MMIMLLQLYQSCKLSPSLRENTVTSLARSGTTGSQCLERSITSTASGSARSSIRTTHLMIATATAIRSHRIMRLSGYQLEIGVRTSHLLALLSREVLKLTQHRLRHTRERLESHERLLAELRNTEPAVIGPHEAQEETHTCVVSPTIRFGAP